MNKYYNEFFLTGQEKKQNSVESKMPFFIPFHLKEPFFRGLYNIRENCYNIMNFNA